MIKKLFLISVVLSQLTISCSNNSDDEIISDPPTAEETLKEQIANILKQPYSKLSPAEQKVKLEFEANEMLTQMNKMKSSSAIEAIQNLKNLLSVSPIDIFGGKNGNEVEDILKVADVYGIYTWDNTKKVWGKINSTSELKFIFPAKIKGTANDATFTSKAVASDVKVKLEDTSATWSYDYETNTGTSTPAINDYYFLPTSTDATLTIGGTQAATFVSNAKFSKGSPAPDEASYKMVLNDGYTFEVNGNKKAIDNTGKGSFTYNGKTLVEFNAGSTTDIDGLLTEEPLKQYKGRVNGLAKILDNFIIAADMDYVTQAKDDEALEKSLIFPEYPDNKNPNSNYKAFYTASNTHRQKLSEGSAANFNKNMKLILISKKDGTKIADIVEHSTKEYSFSTILPNWVTTNNSANYPNGGYWSYSGDNLERFTIQDYEEIYYLKFNDNTEVEMSAYFSTFSEIQTKFNDFLKTFTEKTK